jgi:hypothetical protein
MPHIGEVIDYLVPRKLDQATCPKAINFGAVKLERVVKQLHRLVAPRNFQSERRNRE